ncbi:uncharacterized protein LOC117786216 [Drosophila innubila]|uniref:uncharacterized protein LOC117786216 n=1 Tax=Drosophila innubila TaxID=198719 RepID=UPI00148DE794|nr:uncharacterized protein LOC117786216 [Drosophila innubila]
MDINILDLHFDILILICEQIEKFDDKKNFARTHPKLWNVFAYQHRNDVRSVINFDNNAKYMINHWDFILEWWGSSVTSIYNRYNYVNSGDLMDYAVKFCPNLEFINFVIDNCNIKKVLENLPKLKQLKDIHLNIKIEFNGIWKLYYKKENYIADLIESMQSLTNLRHLNFGTHSLKRKERKQLNKLIQLEELKIGPIQDSDVDDLSTLLGHLRILIIGYYPDTKTISRLAKYCINLESLNLEDDSFRSFSPKFSSKWRVSYFPKLTCLSCDGNGQNDFLYNLDSRYNNQLKVLNMPCLTMREEEIARIANLRALKELFCADVKPSSIDVLVGMQLEHLDCSTSFSLNQMHILRLVRECSMLKDLGCAIYNIDNEFLSELLDILKAKDFQPNRPFNFKYATYFETEINKDQFASMPNSNLMNLYHRRTLSSSNINNKVDR